MSKKSILIEKKYRAETLVDIVDNEIIHTKKAAVSEKFLPPLSGPHHHRGRHPHPDGGRAVHHLPRQPPPQPVQLQHVRRTRRDGHGGHRNHCRDRPCGRLHPVRQEDENHDRLKIPDHDQQDSLFNTILLNVSG